MYPLTPKNVFDLEGKKKFLFAKKVTLMLPRVFK